MLGLLITFLAVKTAVSGGTNTCPPSAILVQNMTTSSNSKYSYALSDALPFVSSTESFDTLAIGFWYWSNYAVTEFVQFIGDGNIYRFGLDLTSASAKAQVSTRQSNLSNLTAASISKESVVYWTYVSFSISYSSRSAHLYVWDAGLFNYSSQSTSIAFTATQNWSFTAGGSTLVLCNQPSLCGSYSISMLSIYLGASFTNPNQYQMYSNPISPQATLIFSFKNYVSEQVTGTNLSLGVGNTPSYDNMTSSLYLSSSTSYLKWSEVPFITNPVRGITVLMKISYNSGGVCGYQKVFSRKSSTGTELYSFGFDSTLANGSLVFSLTLSSNAYRYLIPGTSVFNNSYFHTIAMTTYIFDFNNAFIFTVSVNNSVPTSEFAYPMPSGTLATASYTESTTDQLWIGDNNCSFQGKLAYFYLWNNGGLDNQMGCLSGCNLTMGTISNQTVCLDGCDSSCLTCNGTASSDCLSCPNTRLQYNAINGPTFQCVYTCPAGSFPSQNITVCILCDSSCLTCINTTACTQCTTSSPWMLGSSASLCYSKCPAMTYQNTSSSTCLPCDPSCNTCVGPTSNNCTSCNSSLVLVQNTTCCPQGYTSSGSGCIPPNNTTSTAIAVSNTILTSMSYAPTAAVIVAQLSSTASTSISMGASTASSLFTSSLSSYNLVSYVSLLKMASLFVLMNFPYRQRVLSFFEATIKSQSFPNFFLKTTADSSANDFTTGAFSRINFPSQFLLSFGSYVSEFLVYYVVSVLFHIMTYLFRHNPKVSGIMSKIAQGLYNTVLINIMGSQIPFVISVVVTFQSGYYKDSVGDIFGLVMMIFMIILWLGIFAITAILLFRGKALNETEELNNVRSRENEISMKTIFSEGLLKSFVSDRLIRQLAFPLNLLKTLCIVMFITLSQPYPLLQIVPAIILQAGWLMLDAWSDSKKSKLDFAVNLLENSLILMSFIACLLIETVKSNEAFDYVLISVISAALVLRTLHMIVGIVGIIITKLCARNKLPTQHLSIRNIKVVNTKSCTQPTKDNKSIAESTHLHDNQHYKIGKSQRDLGHSPEKLSSLNSSNQNSFETMINPKSKRLSRRRQNVKITIQG